MKAVEFTTELNGKAVLVIPQDAVARLPKTGKARVIVLTGEQSEDAGWQQGAYQQFLREDPPEDAVYDKLR